ncbi:MAG: CHAD domain-containing protein [Bacteroidales bacterium]|nr:CHAD domain-containing protein [Bacteroidales bacterium]
MPFTGITGSLQLRNIKSLLSRYLSDAVLLMSSGNAPGERSVHDFRVLMKKSKAVLKLVSGQVSGVCYSRNIEAIEEAGRLLSGIRDNSVLRKTLRELRKENKEIFRELEGNSKIGTILKKRGADVGNPAEMHETIERIVELLRKSAYRLRFEPMSELNTDMIVAEMKKTYSDVAGLYLKSRNVPKASNIHRFRKRAKDLLYQLYVFRSPQQPRVKGLEKTLDTLTQNLGKYRDLNQIIKVLDYKYSPGASEQGLDDLVLLIRNREDIFLSKAWSSAYKVFRPGQSLSGLLGDRF